jgi:hypothetical protein
MKITISILLLFVCFGCKIREKNPPVFSIISDGGGSPGAVSIDYDDYAKDTPVTGYLSSEDFKRFVSKQKAYTDETVDKHDTSRCVRNKRIKIKR